MPTTKTPEKTTDLQDSPRDKERLRQDEANLDLPDVEDIPGQEYVRPPKMNEFADTTISSDDEEGENVFNENEWDDDSDVSEEEKEDLEATSESMSSEDDRAIKELKLDQVDFEGELLNEEDDEFGEDLDIPGADHDDDEIEDEDEDNNN